MSKELEKLEDALQKVRMDKAKAEVRIEQIKKGWKEEFDTEDVDEVKTMLENIKARLAKNRTLRDEKLGEANKLLGLV